MNRALFAIAFGGIAGIAYHVGATFTGHMMLANTVIHTCFAVLWAFAKRPSGAR